MKVLAVILIVVGSLWVMMCFLGIAMMSRSVDMLTEAFLPALIGVAIAAIGIAMLTRKPRRGGEPPVA